MRQSIEAMNDVLMIFFKGNSTVDRLVDISRRNCFVLSVTKMMTSQSEPRSLSSVFPNELFGIPAIA